MSLSWIREDDEEFNVAFRELAEYLGIEGAQGIDEEMTRVADMCWRVCESTISLMRKKGGVQARPIAIAIVIQSEEADICTMHEYGNIGLLDDWRENS